VILAGGIVDSQSSGAGIILNINRGTANMYLSGTSTYTGTTSIQGNSGCMVILGGTGGPGTGGNRFAGKHGDFHPKRRPAVRHQSLGNHDPWGVHQRVSGYQR